MRKFHVNVNGTPYEVEVEEIAAGAAPAFRQPLPHPPLLPPPPLRQALQALPRPCPATFLT